MGQQSLIYSFVARGTVILAEYTDFSGNFTNIALQCLQKLPASNNKFNYNCDGHTFNYLADNGFTYCVVAVESVGRQIPLAFLERIKEDFSKRYGGGKAATASAKSLNREFGPKLREHMQYCVDHPEEVSKLAKVKAQVSEVKEVMMENIEKVLDRGEKIEVLVDKTENLRSQAQDFRTQGTQMRREMWLQNMKIKLIVLEKQPVIISDKNQMREWSRTMRSQGKTIGLVPTMGFLHEGHLSLVREAHCHADVVVVSIYVNPGQFSPTEDLSVYPSDFDGDVQKLMAVPGGVDVVFHPYNLYDYEGTNTNKKPASVINYGVVSSCIEQKGTGHETWVRVDNLEKGLCGKSRPIFFRGVATVVTKLFNIVEPDVALFGKKDYQQWRIIQRMVRDLDFSIKVVGSAIIRDIDGLAMSSRNVHLSPEERQRALSINKSLLAAKSAAENGQIDCNKLRNLVIQAITEAGGRIDYGEIVDQESLEAVESIEAPVVFCVAAWFGKVRLIDNMEINL